MCAMCWSLLSVEPGNSRWCLFAQTKYMGNICRMLHSPPQASSDALCCCTVCAELRRTRCAPCAGRCYRLNQEIRDGAYLHKQNIWAIFVECCTVHPKRAVMRFAVAL